VTAPPLNIALVGCGFMGSMHAQVYARLTDARLVAAVDRHVDAASAKLRGLGYPIPVYKSLSELIRMHPQVGAVDICTPADAHEADALLAFDLGRHVFCEKPLTTTLEAADRVIAKAKAAASFVQVGHCIRCWPEYQALHEFIRSNRGGMLLSLSMRRQAGRPGYSDDDWLNKAARSGGAALDLHIHDTDYAISLLGMPAAVTSRGTFDDSGPSHIFTLYEYAGVAVCAEGGWNYPANWGFRMAFQAVFERACIDFDSADTPTLRITWPKGTPEPMPYNVPVTGKSASGEGNVSSFGGYFNELQYFVSSVLLGRAPAMATLEDARRSLAVTLAEIESVRSGKRVALSRDL